MNEQNREKFLRHARLQSPREACALLIIEQGKEELIICRNKSILDDQFVIDPCNFAEASDRGEILAVVHSHPLASSKPSEADIVSCNQSNLTWHIVGCITGEWTTIQPSSYKAPLIGRSWSHGVLDCYSLIRDYYAEILKINLPDYDREFEWWLNGENLYLNHFKDAGFVEVSFDDIKKHDVILMQIQSGVMNHGAIYLGNELILHHLYKRLSSRDIYGGYWLKNTIKIIRHKDLVYEKN